MRKQFGDHFSRPCTVVARAPGRVNLIGEHTDYNDGYVLPVALEQATFVAAAPRDDGQARVYASALEAEHTWVIDDWQAGRDPHWTSYVAGVAALLREQGASLPGFDLYVRSDVPLGSGLSSSAALEVASGLALSHLTGQALGGAALADLARQAEHRYAGVPCGIMDQYISVLGRAESALLLDCRSREFEQIPLRLGDHGLAVINSGVKHELAGGEYAKRQAQCQDALAYFQKLDPEVQALRDVPVERVQEHFDRLEPLAARRARHVTTEIARTLDAAEALRQGMLSELGELLYGSHASLRDDYEVSCRELDLLVEIVSEVPGVVGARMTGGGFGGCIVAVVAEEAVPAVEAAVRERYDSSVEAKATLIATKAGPGASIEYAAA